MPPLNLLLKLGKRADWDYYSIPRSLKYMELDFERNDKITNSGGNIQTIVDPISGASFTQGTAASRPALDATGFNGRQCGTFDGVDDNLRDTTALATLGWPTSGSILMLALFQYTGLISGAATFILNIANTASNANIALLTQADTGVQHAKTRIGSGTTTVNEANNADILTGRHLLIGTYDATTVKTYVDSVASAGTAQSAMSINSTPRSTIGSSGATIAANFTAMKLNFLGMYKYELLTSPFYASLITYLNTRKG